MAGPRAQHVQPSRHSAPPAAAATAVVGARRRQQSKFIYRRHVWAQWHAPSGTGRPLTTVLESAILPRLGPAVPATIPATLDCVGNTVRPAGRHAELPFPRVRHLPAKSKRPSRGTLHGAPAATPWTRPKHTTVVRIFGRAPTEPGPATSPGFERSLLLSNQQKQSFSQFFRIGGGSRHRGKKHTLALATAHCRGIRYTLRFAPMISLLVSALLSS